MAAYVWRRCWVASSMPWFAESLNISAAYADTATAHTQPCAQAGEKLAVGCGRTEKYSGAVGSVWVGGAMIWPFPSESGSMRLPGSFSIVSLYSRFISCLWAHKVRVSRKLLETPG